MGAGANIELLLLLLLLLLIMLLLLLMSLLLLGMGSSSSRFSGFRIFFGGVIGLFGTASPDGRSRRPLPCLKSVHSKPYTKQYLKTSTTTSRARPTMTPLYTALMALFDLRVGLYSIIRCHICKGSNLFQDAEKLRKRCESHSSSVS